jgi:hypothetical protein
MSRIFAKYLTDKIDGRRLDGTRGGCRNGKCTGIHLERLDGARRNSEKCLIIDCNDLHQSANMFHKYNLCPH